MGDVSLAPILAERRTRRVGLLGGSFNPAHIGHLHISLMALKRLNLDEVWWLVSPQNPLKSTSGMAPFAGRISHAQAMTRHHPRIKVTGLEALLDSPYTADTLRQLRKRFPQTRFVWMMGADNLRQISRWNHWLEIFRRVPIAVFARPTYSLSALSGMAAQRFRHRRVEPHSARRLATMPAPAWSFFPIRLDHTSATELRRLGPKGGIAVSSKNS
ncbi:MAG TPA: nicotinate-nucleotide adenylyltransferase [Stellaceae bacterium]|nr:nicotinate-nucleotide adenylyltransferase [Stellaceae bacterium]